MKKSVLNHYFLDVVHLIQQLVYLLYFVLIQFGSIDLVCWIKKKFPEIEFSMIVGEDAFNDICANKWKNVEIEIIFYIE